VASTFGLRRLAGVALALAGAALSPLACAALAGIDDLPLHVADGAPDEPIVPIDAADASDAGCETSSHMCHCVAHDFCDDFDVDGEALGARWSGAVGLPNPFTKGTETIGLTTDALSAPRALLVTAGQPKDSAFALLSEQLDQATAYPGRSFVGFRYTLDIRVESMGFDESRGPLGDSGSAAAAGVFHFDGTNARGVALILGVDGVYLSTAASILSTGLDGGENYLAPIFLGDVLTLSRTWLHVELLAAADSARAVSEGFTSCGAVPGSAVVAAAIGPLRVAQACLALPASVGVSWAMQPVVSAGTVLFGGGQIVLRQDNVAFDFLAP
jgi:hypothetical protein